MRSKNSNYHVVDSDGNVVGKNEHLWHPEEAIAAAAAIAIDPSLDWDQYRVVYQPDADADPYVVCSVERTGPPGVRTVRIALDMVGWFSVERTY